MYFFQELSQSNGQEDAVKWIASQTSASVVVQTTLSRSTSPQNRRPSLDDVQLKDEARPSSDVSTEGEASIHHNQQELQHGTEASKTLLSELGNKAGLLFTDAAHVCFER
eukprot:762021-Hanusia_phi.AAC.4